MVLPVGRSTTDQQIVRVTKNEDGSIETEKLMAVRFVPLVDGLAQDE